MDSTDIVKSAINFTWDKSTGEVVNVYYPKELNHMVALMQADIWMDLRDSCEKMREDAMQVLSLQLSGEDI